MASGQHLSNHKNRIMEWKIDEWFSGEEDETIFMMKANNCTHEICHQWFEKHDNVTPENVMAETIMMNLEVYRKPALPKLTSLQASKILESIQE